MRHGFGTDSKEWVYARDQVGHVAHVSAPRGAGELGGRLGELYTQAADVGLVELSQAAVRYQVVVRLRMPLILHLM